MFCPDAPGRARSENLADPTGYSYPQYIADAIAVFNGHFGLTDVHWIGTSMGGLIAMFVAATPACPLKCGDQCAVPLSMSISQFMTCLCACRDELVRYMGAGSRSWC